MTTLVRSASLTNFDDIARQCGLDPLALLAEVGLPARCLKDADLKVPAKAIGRLLELAAGRASEPAFGLRMAESRRLSNLGPLGLLLRDEPTLKDALQAMVRYIRVHNEALVIHVDHVGDRVFIREEMNVQGEASLRQSTELALGVTFRLISLFMGAGWRPRQVCFSHAAPKSLGVHRRVFGQALAFGGEFNGIVCTASELDSPNPSADPVMTRYAQQLVDASAGSEASFAEQVRQLVLLLLPLGQCNAKVVARHLGCDRRTIVRRLDADGTSFHQLVNDYRTQLVKHYIDENTRPLAQVSAIIGFASPSAFSRWYRQQFGEAARMHRSPAVAGRV
jgi:AraC-like DNA-binding protein